MIGSDDSGLWDIAVARAAATPDAVFAVDDGGRRLTFAALLRAAETRRDALAALGVRPGDVVSWQLPNWVESFVLTLALHGMGAIQNPLIMILREREVGHITGQAGADFLIGPGSWSGHDFTAMYRNVVAAGAAPAGVRLLETTPDGLLSEVVHSPLPGRAGTPAPWRTDGETRWLFSTSGTTSAPKLVRHGDRAVLHAARTTANAVAMAASDVVASPAPVTHVGGIVNFLVTLLSGSSQVVQERFDPVGSPLFFREHDITITGIGEPFFRAFLACAQAHPELAPLFPRIRAFQCGGAPKNPALHGEMRAVFGGAGIISGYGMTECPMLAWNAIGDSDDVLATTEGRAAVGMQVRTVALDGTPCGVGEEGELRVRGPHLMLGYADPADGLDAFDDEGYLRTGDLGRLDPAGNVTVTGRVKDVIIRNMENVSAREVEDLLVQHPDVLECAVVGVPDPVTGERVCAVIAVRAGATAPTLSELGEHLGRLGLSRRKWPERLSVVDVLPRNAMGKVAKPVLRAWSAEEVGT
ncbi:MAG TPA: AMP-binding protein [Mycobacteriales bacterium]|nr:AMP-binding protein [Mycobacteriales bacterium]